MSRRRYPTPRHWTASPPERPAREAAARWTAPTRSLRTERARLLFVLGRVTSRRGAGGGGDKLHVKIAVHNLHGDALGGDCGIVHGLKAGPTDGHGAIETRAIGFVEHILNGGERRRRKRGRSQPHSREKETQSHDPSGKKTRPRRNGRVGKRNPPADYSLAGGPARKPRPGAGVKR